MKKRSPSPKEKNNCEDKDEEDGNELFSSLRGSIQEDYMCEKESNTQKNINIPEKF